MLKNVTNAIARIENRLPDWLLFLLLGAISALALPPVGWWPVLGVTFFVALRRLESRGFATHFHWFKFGFCLGLGYLGAALYWIGVAFTVDATAYLWMMPFAVGGLSGVLALYWGLAFMLSRWLVSNRRSVQLPLFMALPFALTLTELLRGVLFTGFPWAVPGLVAETMGGTMQAASVIGMPGLTFMVLLWACLPHGFYLYWKTMPVFRSWLLLLALLLPVHWGWGEFRLIQNPTVYNDKVVVRLVQPNISQDDKWRSDNAKIIFEGLMALSRLQGDLQPTHIIWPESAVPFLLDESRGGLTQIAGLLGPDHVLITGAIRRNAVDSRTKEQAYFTSVEVIDGGGTVVGTYDKWRLVPGGEYLPFAAILEPLGFRKVVNLPESFNAGVGPQSIAIPGAGFAAPQICYEAIFPQLLPDIAHRPDWIVNVTNDGWFGQSTGPYQHLAQVRMRSVEQGLAIARAANTGISAVFDPLGRLLSHAALSTQGIVDSRLPLSLPPTIFARFGLLPAIAIIFLLVAITGILSRKKK